LAGCCWLWAWPSGCATGESHAGADRLLFFEITGVNEYGKER
jgi:hypothetical protein